MESRQVRTIKLSGLPEVLRRGDSSGRIIDLTARPTVTPRQFNRPHQHQATTATTLSEPYSYQRPPSSLSNHQVGQPNQDIPVKNNQKRTFCHACNSLEKSVNRNKPICFKCKSHIEESDGPALRFQGETYHSYHFNCTSCGVELKPDAKKANGTLYCHSCHDRIQDSIPNCGLCHKPVEERGLTALGKHWHPEHFVCATCERPFHGKRHYEVKGLAYCEQHAHQLSGHQCRTCLQAIRSDVISPSAPNYCVDQYNCHLCHNQFIPSKSKFSISSQRPTPEPNNIEEPVVRHNYHKQPVPSKGKFSNPIHRPTPEQVESAEEDALADISMASREYLSKYKLV